MATTKLELETKETKIDNSLPDNTRILEMRVIAQSRGDVSVTNLKRVKEIKEIKAPFSEIVSSNGIGNGDDLIS